MKFLIALGAPRRDRNSFWHAHVQNGIVNFTLEGPDTRPSHASVKTFVSCYRTPGPQKGFRRGFEGVSEGVSEGFSKVLEGCQKGP